MKKTRSKVAAKATDADGKPLRRAMYIRSGGTSTIQPDHTETPDPQTKQDEVNDHAG